MQKHLSKRAFVYLFLIALPVLLYFFIVIRSSSNFPIIDDYDAILRFLISYEQTPVFSHTLEIIIQQHNEHRIIIGKLITLLYYNVFGTINFIHLIFIGNISLIGILAVLMKATNIEPIDKRLLVFIPVSLFLFNFRYYEVSCWAMASVSIMWVILFAFLSLYFLLNDTRQSVFYCILFATLATFTSGNGILVYITGISVLLLKGSDKRTFILLISAFILNLSGLIVGFHKVSDHPSILQSFLMNPLDLFLYPLHFIGSLFFLKWTVFTCAVGFITLAGCAMLFIKKVYKTNYILTAFLLFMLLTIGIISLSRFGFGIEQANSSRYKINTTVLYVVISLLVYQAFEYTFSRKKYFIAALAFSLLFTGISGYSLFFSQFTAAKKRNIALIDKGMYAKYEISDPSPHSSIHTFNEANHYHIFKTHKLSYSKGLIVNDKKINADTSDIVYHVDDFAMVNDSIFKITGWMFMKNKSSMNTAIVLGLEDSLSRLYVEIPQSIFRKDITLTYSKDHCNYNYSGFTKEVILSDYPKGNYQLSLLLMTDSSSLYKMPMHKTIEINTLNKLVK